jgi:hypothetical protein
MLPSIGREHAALSVTDNCRYGAVMAPAYLNSVRTAWSILLSFKETLGSPAPLLNAHATLKHEVSIGQR